VKTYKNDVSQFHREILWLLLLRFVIGFCSALNYMKNISPSGCRMPRCLFASSHRHAAQDTHHGRAGGCQGKSAGINAIMVFLAAGLKGDGSPLTSDGP